MRAVGEAHRSGGAGDFLHGDHVLEIAEARAAIFLLHGDAVQAEFAHLRPEIARKLVRTVDLLGARGDLLLGEVAHSLADRIGGFAEVEIEGFRGVRQHSWLLHRPLASGAPWIACRSARILGSSPDLFKRGGRGNWSNEAASTKSSPALWEGSL
jgi:hypothetical protein